MKYLGMALILLVAYVGFAFLYGQQNESNTNDQPQSSQTNTIGGQSVIDDPEESEQAQGSPKPVLVLDLSNKGLSEVPMTAFDPRDIEKLDLSHNKLTGAIPAEVRTLAGTLRVLDLSDNELTGVPAEVGQLHKLEVLDLSNNKLTGLPYELGNLQNLRRLDLRGNTYATQDLAIIQSALPETTQILID